jgi:lysozyme family protein
MADFDLAVKPLFIAEGGYSNSATDSGGETKYGISKRSYPHVDIANLSQMEAAVIMKRDFWDFYHIGTINDQNAANRIFLLFVNTDPTDAAKVVQNAVNDYGILPAISVDGYMGPVTIARINALSTPRLFVNTLRLEECRYYLGLVDHNLSQLPNLRGWIRRALNG